MNDKIYEILEEMEDELKEAEEYAEKAIECARYHSSHKSTYISLSEDEMKHYEKLEAMLKAYEIPEDMKWYVDKKHGHMLKKHSEIKYMLNKANE
jgi:DNA-binding protein H-NS